MKVSMCISRRKEILSAKALVYCLLSRSKGRNSKDMPCSVRFLVEGEGSLSEHLRPSVHLLIEIQLDKLERYVSHLKLPFHLK